MAIQILNHEKQLLILTQIATLYQQIGMQLPHDLYEKLDSLRNIDDEYVVVSDDENNSTQVQKISDEPDANISLLMENLVTLCDKHVTAEKINPALVLHELLIVLNDPALIREEYIALEQARELIRKQIDLVALQTIQHASNDEVYQQILFVTDLYQYFSPESKNALHVFIANTETKEIKASISSDDKIVLGFRHTILEQLLSGENVNYAAVKALAQTPGVKFTHTELQLILDLIRPDNLDATYKERYDFYVDILATITIQEPETLLHHVANSQTNLGPVLMRAMLARLAAIPTDRATRNAVLMKIFGTAFTNERIKLEKSGVDTYTINLTLELDDEVTEQSLRSLGKSFVEYLVANPNALYDFANWSALTSSANANRVKNLIIDAADDPKFIQEWQAQLKTPRAILSFVKFANIAANTELRGRCLVNFERAIKLALSTIIAHIDTAPDQTMAEFTELLDHLYAGYNPLSFDKRLFRSAIFELSNSASTERLAQLDLKNRYMCSLSFFTVKAIQFCKQKPLENSAEINIISPASSSEVQLTSPRLSQS